MESTRLDDTNLDATHAAESDTLYRLCDNTDLYSMYLDTGLVDCMSNIFVEAADSPSRRVRQVVRAGVHSYQTGSY